MCYNITMRFKHNNSYSVAIKNNIQGIGVFYSRNDDSRIIWTGPGFYFKKYINKRWRLSKELISRVWEEV